MKNLEKIRLILAEHRPELKKKFGLREIGIFGSFFTGKQRRRSDVDILVEFDVVPGLLKFLELEHYISELLGIRVDLVRKKSIREELRERILGEVVML